MRTFKYIIQAEEGLHARPARLLVKEAGKLPSTIMIDKDGHIGDAKKIFSVMGLGAKKGDEITIKIEGETEGTDAKILQEFFESNL